MKETDFLNGITPDRELIKYLTGFITPQRAELFEQVLSKRTRRIGVAVEDLYQPHNASAVMRTCDCFGVQDMHVVEDQNPFLLSKDIERGSSKWISLHKYPNTTDFMQTVRQRGYKIIGTSPHTDKTLNDVAVDQPLILFFGTEGAGLTDEALAGTDENIKIPMFGFTESFNISVSAAVCLHTLVSKLHASQANWGLSEDEKQELRFRWLCNTVKNSELIVKDFLAERKASS